MRPIVVFEGSYAGGIDKETFPVGRDDWSAQALSHENQFFRIVKPLVAALTSSSSSPQMSSGKQHRSGMSDVGYIHRKSRAGPLNTLQVLANAARVTACSCCCPDAVDLLTGMHDLAAD